MAEQQPSGGSIVNISSLSGVRGPEKFPGLAAYNVSKAGLLALSDILAVEGKPHGIRVNAVSPGAVETAMLRQAGHGLKALATPGGRRQDDRVPGQRPLVPGHGREPGDPVERLNRGSA